MSGLVSEDCADTISEQYHTLPGSDIAIPVMSLGKGLEKLPKDPKSRIIEDPVAKAIRSGKAPTVRDVKMSLKVRYFHNILIWGVFIILTLGLVEDFNACHASYGDSP
jgi:hypothetical protein